MSMVAWKPAGPISSAEFQIVDPERISDIQHKHRLVTEFLESRRFDALLLQKASNFAWFSSGGDCSRGGNTESTASIFITPDARVVVTTSSDSAQLFDRELQGLGFQLKERPWHEPRAALIDDLCRGRRVASDTGVGQTHNISSELTSLRIPLATVECRRAREVGAAVAHAIEATCRNCHLGQTEADLAGEVAHRLIRHRVVPERIQISSDGRSQAYPHWSYSDEQFQRCVSISAVGRKYGLCIGASRTVSFGQVPSEVLDAHRRTMLIQATGMFFTQPEWAMFEIWNRIQRIYEKFGVEEQWRNMEQAEIIGYDVTEVPLVPRSEFHIAPRMAMHWHPSVGPAISGDTILVKEDGNELLTPFEGWPRLKVEVKGTVIYRPEILQREV
ncbi:MAG: M24 family metallopeptidase [Planctomycetaceae bacterium]